MTQGWGDLAAAAKHLAISEDKLREAMDDSRKAGLEEPWVDHRGRDAERHAFRFCFARLDAWMLEVAAWRASDSSRAGGGKSDGRASTVNLERERARRSGKRTSSSPKSKATSPSDASGDPVTILRSLRLPTP